MKQTTFPKAVRYSIAMIAWTMSVTLVVFSRMFLDAVVSNEPLPVTGNNRFTEYSQGFHKRLGCFLQKATGTTGKTTTQSMQDEASKG